MFTGFYNIVNTQDKSILISLKGREICHKRFTIFKLVIGFFSNCFFFQFWFQFWFQLPCSYFLRQDTQKPKVLIISLDSFLMRTERGKGVVQIFTVAFLVLFIFLNKTIYLNMNSCCKINALKVCINHIEKLAKMKYNIHFITVYKEKCLPRRSRLHFYINKSPDLSELPRYLRD